MATYKTVQFKEQEIESIRKVAKRMEQVQKGVKFSDRQTLLYALACAEDNLDKLEA